MHQNGHSVNVEYIIGHFENSSGRFSSAFRVATESHFQSHSVFDRTNSQTLFAVHAPTIRNDESRMGSLISTRARFVRSAENILNGALLVV